MTLQPRVKYRVDCILDPEWKSGIIDQLSQPLKEKDIKENIIIICITVITDYHHYCITVTHIIIIMKI